MTSDTPTWRPLLDGTAAREAEAALHEIVDAIGAIEPRPDEDPSLAGGAAGLAILYAYLDRAYPGRGHEDRAVAALDRAFTAVSERPFGLGLFDGFTGVAWAAEHLRGSIVDPASDPNASTERVIANFLDETEPPQDLTHGLVGVGVYLLARPAEVLGEMIDRVVARIELCAVPAPAGVWFPSGQLEAGLYDAGLAHGAAGVAALLGRVVAAGRAGASAAALLDRTVEGLRCATLPAGAGSRFPAMVSREAGGEIKVGPTRGAWCYGDPGVAAALLAAARGAWRSEWADLARDTALLAARRAPADMGVVDAGLCHGAAGLAHVFNRLHQATGEAALAEAARAWFSRALAMRGPGGIGGIRSFLPRLEGGGAWVDDPGLLTGAAGVALALLAAISPIEPAWDSALLLDVGANDLARAG